MHNKNVIAYYTSWCNYPPRNYLASDIPAEKLTHINYAFANIVDGKIALGDKWADIEKQYDVPVNGRYVTVHGNFGLLNDAKGPVRTKNPNMQVLISVGGWTWSKDFSDVALTPQSREIFANSVIEFIQQYGFDGVDIDWEYPCEGGMDHNKKRPQDKQNYTALLKLLREKLDHLAACSKRRRYLLSIAAPGAESFYRHLEMKELSKVLDFVNVMTYVSAWSPATAHHAPLYPFVHNAVQGYLHHGFSSTQVNLGIPFYGRTFANVQVNRSSKIDGLGCPFSGVGAGTHEPGIIDFDDYISNYTSSKGYHPQHDSTAQADSLWNPTKKEWISTETVNSVTCKCDYVKKNNLGGVFWWEQSMDRNAVLTEAVRSCLTHKSRIEL
ncbi:glycoside hydrolase [Paraphysoderma sedebokerense]|nr:glycoside hydrolase [Paraphysoderma sedebokerense]